MADSDVIRPFRWNMSRRAELGRLADAPLPELPDGFDDELLEATVRVVGLAGDSDLVFVGRSPEYMFDLLGGLLECTDWADRLDLLFLSLWTTGSYESFMNKHAWEVPLLRRQLESIGLAPADIIRRPRAVTLVDLVSEGGTFEILMRVLEAWCREVRLDWKAVRPRIRIIGLTCRGKTSPNAWRWQQHAEWRHLLPDGAIKNVSISWPMYRAIGDVLPKATERFPPHRWSDPSVNDPARSDKTRSAIALAVHLYDLGRSNDTRRGFVRLLTNGPSGRERWARELAGEVRP